MPRVHANTADGVSFVDFPVGVDLRCACCDDQWSRIQEGSYSRNRRQRSQTPPTKLLTVEQQEGEKLSGSISGEGRIFLP